MDFLRRQSTPLSERVWKTLDEAVAQAARHVLVGRRVATFDGPKGWEHVAARLGTVTPCETKEGTASVYVPDVILLAEIRANFSVQWAAMEAFERGAPALDTEAAELAAREAALAEDRLVLYAEPTGTGFLTWKESTRVKVGDWSKGGRVISDLVKAVEVLDGLGIPGPYEAVLASAPYYAYLRAVGEAGYPAARQLKDVVSGVHRSPIVREAGAVFSTRGGDFVMTVGCDLSVGYRADDRDAIHLFCVETVAAQTMTPKAVCLLER
jgi:uncharacterized linocin/CFP29 family protein